MTAQTSTATVHSAGYLLRRAVRGVLNYGLLSLLGFFFLFPILFMLVSSLKTNEGQILRDVTSLKALLPYGSLGLQNYFDVFGRMPFHRFMLNSVFIVGAIVALGLLVNSTAAYALARLNWKGRGVLLGVVIALIIIPFEAVAVPLLLMVNRFGWVESYHVQIIPFIADAFSIFLFYQFFIGLPKDLEEAALVDGAGRFRIYWNIIVPLSRPVFATVAILQFLTHWNDYMWPLMVTRAETYRPLMIAMQQFFGQYPRLWGDIMAFASMITVPVLIVFLLFQKWFVQSVATSGIKGG
ncbi:MAG TPA: carbohydrate ABC transporter permease [Anaerolineales bacterium]|nr:carbohydrate ABC transporter permease [Anaerolineae bacterium]HIQ02091.1 carbohydrate ABC transporter permease [Anaerolineales bacterium]